MSPLGKFFFILITALLYYILWVDLGYWSLVMKILSFKQESFSENDTIFKVAKFIFAFAWISVGVIGPMFLTSLAVLVGKVTIKLSNIFDEWILK